MTRTTQQGNTLDAAYRGPSCRAADERVTPRELAEAVAAVERRHADPPRQDGRISLGEAVEQLGLDATPEELLAEVESRRRAEALFRFAQAQRRRRVRWGATVLAAGALWAGGVVGAAQVQRRATPPLSTVTYSAPSPVDPARIVVTERTAAGPVVKTLAEVPEGAPALVRPDVLSRVIDIDGTSRAAIDWHEGQSWTLVRRANRVYLRGYLQAPATDGAFLVGPVKLMSRPWPYSPPASSPAVEVPFGAFRVAGTGSAEFGALNTLTIADATEVRRPAASDVDKRAGAE